jgi:hypothetical protein
MVNPRYFYRGFFIVLPQNSEDRWRFQFSLALKLKINFGYIRNSIIFVLQLKNNNMSKLHREENKRMVGVLKLQNWSTEQIAKRLGLTKNQVDHISSYYYGKKKHSMVKKKNENINVFDFEENYKITTKENKIVENVKTNSPISKTINLNGLEIEIMSNSIKKVIITEDNKIKLL